jgi:demethylmenaquinone methyltransferase/2-methoxy-6-polyprenyl-1,4-benzoquinol methylase
MASSKAPLFNRIAKRYDFLNRLFSFGIDRSWRKNLILMVQDEKPDYILDVATGTGDLAIEVAQRMETNEIIGLDPAKKMLEKAQEKIAGLQLKDRIKLKRGEVESLPFPKNTFDTVTTGFGVRNFDDLQKGLKEMHRVLKPGGSVFILEFTLPRNFILRQLHLIYLALFIPFIAFLFTSRLKEYFYLYKSIRKFPKGLDFVKELEQAGFKQLEMKPLTFGISTIYKGKK